MSETKKTEEKAPLERTLPEERREVSVHRTRLGGRDVAYTATAGSLNLNDLAGKPSASIFYVAYHADEAGSNRPITFAFNGGPGSASVWLHLGSLGPRRVEMPDAVASGPPPYQLVDNLDGILDATDLVFIDPIGTGFSVARTDEINDDYHSVKGDIESLTEFIWRYLQRTGRWNSPRYLAGESYGTTRAAAIANTLQEKGLPLSGLMLISPALSFQTFIDGPGNDLPYLLFLPSYAMAAWYHQRSKDRAQSLEALATQMRAFVDDVYAPALMKGANLDPKIQRQLAEKISALIGISADLVDGLNLRIPPMVFAKALLGKIGHTIGRLDARYTGPDADPSSSNAVRDPSFDGPHGAYAGLINGYLRQTLGFDPDQPYQVFSMAVNEGWTWRRKKLEGFLDTSDDLRLAMTSNPHLRVWVAAGYFDLATPFYASEYTASHLGIDRSLQDRVQITHYPAGHMMYFHAESRAALRQDFLSFLSD